MQIMRIMPNPGDSISPPARRRASGIGSLDAALGGGLAYGRVHEIYADDPAEAGAATGFALALAATMNGSGGGGAGGGVLWLRARQAVRQGGICRADGWADLGGAPGGGLIGVVPDAIALLRAAADALRCAALGAVIVESWGRMRELDLTASRRLALAAEASGVPLFVLRIAAAPVPSAAQTRWQVAAAPSAPLPARAPGWPTFDITLLRQRAGPSGLDWRVEWNRDRHIFQEASLSGAVVSPVADRPLAQPGPGAGHTGGRYAA